MRCNRPQTASSHIHAPRPPHPPPNGGPPVSLWLGPLAVLTPHRGVIHYRSCRFATLEGKACEETEKHKTATEMRRTLKDSFLKVRALRARELREISASLFFLALFLFLSVHSTVEPSLSTIISET